MRTGLRCAVLLLLFAIGGCVPAGPPFGSVASTLPPVPAGSARLYFYRWLEIYETTTPTTAYLNGNPVGVTETGAVFYRDVAPGQYTISVWSEGIYPDQFKSVTLKPGDVAYARVESLRSWVPCGGGGSVGMGSGAGEGCADTFVVVLIDPGVAQAELRDLHFIRG